MRTSAGERTTIEIEKIPSKMLSNNVLIRVDDMLDDGHTFKTESGLEIELAGGEYEETTRVVRCGKVARVPSVLTMRTPKNPDGMEWKTSVDVKEGDLVYFGIMASANALELKIPSQDDHTHVSSHFLIDYREIIMRERNGAIQPLNGFVLMKKIMEDKVQIKGLLLDFVEKRDKNKGVITHVGEANEYYVGVGGKDEFSEDADVAVGDVVSLSIPAVTALEDNTFAEMDEEYYYCQRRWINSVE